MRLPARFEQDLGRSESDADHPAITADVEDVDAVRAQIESPPAELLAAMQRRGVVPPLKVFVER